MEFVICNIPYSKISDPNLEFGICNSEQSEEPVPYIITNLCTNDGACVEVCPVACIHTKPGAPIAVGKMDKAEARSAELAFNKAYTAAAFHVSTTELVPQGRQPWLRSLVISHRGKILPMAGALPIVNGVTIVGAIGVAGASRPEQDLLCCRAGLSVWESGGH